MCSEDASLSPCQVLLQHLQPLHSALGCMQVSHDDKGITSVSFLEGVDVRRPGRVADLLARAMRQRAVGATATNEHSSRSHMVFTLAITGTNAASGQEVHGELRTPDEAWPLFHLAG